MEPDPTPAVQESPTKQPNHRFATLLFPPAGLLLLMQSRDSALQKLIGVTFIGFYSILYVGGLIFLAVKTEVLFVEWPGSGLPTLTHRLAVTDYDSLEQHRSQQVVASTNRNGGNYWTSFRGPRGDGEYAEQDLNLDWAAHPPKLLWKQPVGGGYSSFVIAAGMAYTLEQRREEEALVAYDVNTGTELWANTWKAEFRQPPNLGGLGPRSTPLWHEGKVYALGALGELVCMSAVDGNTLWRTNALNESSTSVLQFACTASPLMVDDQLIVLTGHPAGKSGRGMVAYAPDTGERLWASITEKVAYATPTPSTLLGQKQLLVFSASHLIGIDEQTGKELWRFPWNVKYDNSIAQPVAISDHQVFISGGYGKGCALLEFSREGERWKVDQVWKNLFMKNKFTSSVFHDGHIYGLDETMLVCLEPNTGRKQWKEGRYGYGQIILTHGHIIVQCGNGDLALIKADPEEPVEIARIEALGGKTWNQPALADGRLLIRNHAKMACYDLRPE